MSLFINKTQLITGGIGSFGNAILSRFMKDDNPKNQIRILIGFE